MEKVNKKDFVELKYTGYTQGQVFDSNIEEDLKKIDPNGKPRETTVIVGEGMVVSGLDKELEGKELGKEYNIELKAKDAFGERKRELVRIIPLKMFHDQKVDPKPGMVFTLDNNLVKIVAVSGGRVSVDFNNPLAGKNIDYKFTVVRKITDESERTKTAFNLLFRFTPEFEIKDKVVIKGAKAMQIFVDAFKDKFKELIGKDLAFELKEEKKETKTEDKKEESK